jgi:hypothetical protein
VMTGIAGYIIMPLIRLFLGLIDMV